MLFIVSGKIGSRNCHCWDRKFKSQIVKVKKFLKGGLVDGREEELEELLLRNKQEKTLGRDVYVTVVLKFVSCEGTVGKVSGFSVEVLESD